MHNKGSALDDGGGPISGEDVEGGQTVAQTDEHHRWDSGWWFTSNQQMGHTRETKEQKANGIGRSTRHRCTVGAL